MTPTGDHREAFVDRVRELYRRDPAGVSSIAYWKLEGFLRESEVHEVIEGGETHLYAVRGDQLVFYWSERGGPMVLDTDRLRGFDLLVLHERCETAVAPLADTHHVFPSVALFFDPASAPPPVANPAYEVCGFDFAREQEYEDLARLIRETESRMSLPAAAVRSWRDGPAFDPALWLWVRERATGIPVAVGVANYYAPVRETDLDWIYVLPAHQGRGVGRMLIAELIARSRERSDTIRVSGQADGFYMKCGFRPASRWLIVRRKPLEG